jgi:hypothetical protein
MTFMAIESRDIAARSNAVFQTSPVFSAIVTHALLYHFCDRKSRLQSGQTWTVQLAAALSGTLAAAGGAARDGDSDRVLFVSKLSIDRHAEV